MSEQRIEKSKAAVEAADHIPAEKKAELLESLAKLKPAITEVSQTHKEDAQSIARLLEASTHEATRKEKRAGALKKVLDELKVCRWAAGSRAEAGRARGRIFHPAREYGPLILGAAC